MTHPIVSNPRNACGVPDMQRHLVVEIKNYNSAKYRKPHWAATLHDALLLDIPAYA